MKILCIRHTDEPAKNICASIKRHSSHIIIIKDRNVDPNKFNVDLVFYYNICDLFKDHVMSRAINCKHPIVVGIQSYKIVLQNKYDLLKKIPKLIGISTLNNDLKKILEPIYNLPIITSYCSANELLFRETKPINKNGKLRIGYVGTFRKDKQFNKIMKPLMSDLKHNISFNIAGKAGKKMLYPSMPQFYNSIDLLLCTSNYEGGPLPPIEAAFCGRPTLTTKVGFMEDCFGDFDVFFENLEDLQEKILNIIHHRKVLLDMADYVRDFVYNNWHWKHIIKYTDQIFEESLK